MSRPTRFEDLSEYDRQGPEIARIDYAYLMSLPRRTIVRLLKVTEALDQGVASGLLDKEGDQEQNDTVTYRLRPTAKDRERKLRAAQGQWDGLKERYEQALEDPGSIPEWCRYGVARWAKEEGLPAPDWGEGA